MSTTLKLLLLEDDPSDAELISNFLRRSGLLFGATFATDRTEFETAILCTPFDAILADNSLPQFNSLEALQLATEQSPMAAFILVTGTVSEEFAVNIIHKGADDYILKNNLTRLPSAINQAVEKRRAISDRKRAEEALRKSEEKYRLLFNQNPLPAWVIDNQTNRFLAVNDAAVNHYGYTHEEFPGMLLTTIQPGTAIETAPPGVVKHVKKDGLAIDAEIITTGIAYDSKSARLVIINDLTEKIKSENEIREINQELHELSSHLQNIREEERIKIARDIHDELGQQLTALKMDVSSLKKHSNPNDPGITGKFTGILSLIEDIVNSVRRISTQLRPSIIDDLGLVAALEWQSEEIACRYGIKINFVCDLPEVDAPVTIITGLFRIYQEALTNVVRHARATTVHSCLKSDHDHIILEVIDDGQGIDLEKVNEKSAVGKSKSFGLLGIKERVFAMHGHYQLKSEPGKGTCLYVSVPSK